MLGGSVNLEGTLYKRRFSYLFGARYKTNKYLLNSMNTKAEYNPSFYDIQCYLNYNINDNLQINLLSNISRNKFIMISVKIEIQNLVLLMRHLKLECILKDKS